MFSAVTLLAGWLLIESQPTKAERLIRLTLAKQNINRGQLTVHADRGSSMTNKTVAWLLSDLGVAKSHSRPHVSNDNPFSEAQFKTLKYQPAFPERFGSIEDARTFCQSFFHWYNHQHRHGGIGLLTPTQLHYGQAPEVINHRQGVLNRAYALHPERFVRRRPTPSTVPTEVWINPPPQRDHLETTTIIFSD